MYFAGGMCYLISIKLLNKKNKVLFKLNSIWVKVNYTKNGKFKNLQNKNDVELKRKMR